MSQIQEQTPENSLSVAEQDPIGIHKIMTEAPYFPKPTSQEIRVDLEALTKAIEQNDPRTFRQVTFTMTNQEIAQVRILEEELNVL